MCAAAKIYAKFREAGISNVGKDCRRRL
jgi:hypothetical protein